jgi:peptide chain release factor 2
MPGGSFDLDNKKDEVADLNEQIGTPGFWDDPNAAREVTKRLARYERIFNQQDKLVAALEEAGMLLDMAAEESDLAVLADVERDLKAVDVELRKLEMESLFYDEYDDYEAIVSVHAGAGGVDAQDWAEILLRMYLRHLEKAGFQVTLEEVQRGEEAGIKSASFTVAGDHSYGWMVGEKGVHRLVRISPFDSAARRHTSFAAVDVIPEVAEAEEIEINSDDLRVDTFRSSGAGGQHVNTSDSAVRITHLPTGIVVGSQAERSQIQNRARAMKLLQVRLADKARQDRLDHIDGIRGEQTEAAWGHQIRSYVMQPYQMVKDLRTGTEVGNVAGVLDGDLDEFVEGYLMLRRANHEIGSD